MILFAAILSSIAAISGILAVGSGRHWNFTITDYFRGKRNAILYLWVIGSAIFSICHSGVLIEYGVHNSWVVPAHAMKWMFIHSAMGILLTFAHIFVATTLSKEVGPVDKYLWGAKRRAV